MMSVLQFSRRFMPSFTRTCSTSNGSNSTMVYQDVPRLLYKQVGDARSVQPPSDIKTVKLEGRKMSDSYAKVTIPLTGNKKARLRYLTAKGTIRTGRLLEDLDHYAVWLCYLHNRTDPSQLESPGSLPRSIVTGCVDRIGMHGESLTDRDIHLDGHVTWTGRSSMETTMRVFQIDANDSLHQVMKATFVLVSRDASDLNRSMPVHPLIATTPDEAAVIHAGAEANAERRYKGIRSLLKSAPSVEEWNTLHDIFKDNLSPTSTGNYSNTLKPNQVPMEDTEVRNTHVCFPEFQNIYGKIFGGFLMKEAIELAFIAGRQFCKGPVSLVSVDDILFREAVKIGEMIQFTARVSYTKDHFMQVRVYAETCDEYFQQRKTSNVFHVTLAADDAKKVNEVVPGDYASGMLYLSGKRKFEKVQRFGL